MRARNFVHIARLSDVNKTTNGNTKTTSHRTKTQAQTKHHKTKTKTETNKTKNQDQDHPCTVSPLIVLQHGCS